MSKDEIQKIILSALGFIGLIYCYFTFFLGPLNKSRETMTQEIADTQAKTASSKTEMKKTANLELQAKEATSPLRRAQGHDRRRRADRVVPAEDAQLFRRARHRQSRRAAGIERRVQTTGTLATGSATSGQSTCP